MILKETILTAFNERGTLLKWLKTVERLIRERALLKPTNNPQSTEIVAVDDTGAQVMLEVGTGLTIDNGVLKFADVYDGTVIIEKAGVLGLRKFKSSMTVASSEVFTDNTDTAFEQYGFSISPITFEEAGITITGLSCLLNFNNQDVIGEGVLTYIEGDIGIGAIAQTLTYLSTLGIDTFNVTATNNSTVDKWLLANTEGVSV